MAELKAKEFPLRNTPSLFYNNLTASTAAIAYVHRDEVHLLNRSNNVSAGPVAAGTTTVKAFGDKILAASKEEAIVLGGADTQKISSIKFTEPEPFLTRGIAVIGDDLAFVGHSTGAISRLSLKEGKALGSINDNSDSITALGAGKVGGEDVVVGCDMAGGVNVYSADGKLKGKADVVAGDTPVSVAIGSDLIAVGYGSGKIRMFNSAARKKVEIAAHARWINAIAFDDSGKMLASVGEDQLIQVWGVDGGKVSQKGFKHFPNALLTGVAGSEGKFFVSAYDTSTLWEVSF